MLKIEPQENHLSIISNKQVQRGRFRTIIILTEKDLTNLDTVLCGVSAELIIVPRQLTKQEEEIINLSIYVGFKKIGKIVVL